jgi:hypothetical protein
MHTISNDRMIRGQIFRPRLDLLRNAMKRTNDEAVVFAEGFLAANVQEHGC